MTKQTEIKGGVGDSLPHESAHLHVSGEAQYTDDLPEPKGTLYAAIGLSERAHARIKSIDLAPVRNAEGVVAVIAADDVPGSNTFGSVVQDDYAFADGLVEYVGQSVFAVAAKTMEQARRAARMAVIEYEDLEPVLDVTSAIKKESYLMPTFIKTHGDPETALKKSKYRLQGQFSIGGQEQFYLEGQISLVVPQEDNNMYVYCSTQYPHENQLAVARALGCQAKNVRIDCRRMGGGFGGKETTPSLFAIIAALLANKTGKPVKLRLDRDDDMEITGKRHDFEIEYDVGFDENGVIKGIDYMLASRCGMSTDLSIPVNERAMLHVDNAYYLENVHITSHRLKTNTVSNNAFRGFGVPQGMMAIEYVMDDIARYLGKDPLEVRKSNFYGVDDRNLTHFGMTIDDNVIHELVDELEESSNYQQRRKAVREFNKESPYLKKGIALTPIKFGVSFNTLFLNQATALINIYSDGSITLNHGGTEMGQGLFTKVAQVVAEVFQIDIENIKSTATDTDKIPNASSTSSSASTDFYCNAAHIAANKIKDRLTEFAAQEFNVSAESINYEKNRVIIGKETLTFAELVNKAWFNRVSLTATGFHRTPDYHWDEEAFEGSPFYYCVWGASVSEVMIDTLTGELKVERVDLLHDAGKPINPAIDMGQLEGAFVQGMGWLTTEELRWNEQGKLSTHAPSTYKIPVSSDLPKEFNARFYTKGIEKKVMIYRSKAIGEPPLMLAISVFHAIKDAIASVYDYKYSPQLNAPTTPEEILKSIDRMSMFEVQNGQEKQQVAV